MAKVHRSDAALHLADKARIEITRLVACEDLAREDALLTLLLADDGNERRDLLLLDDLDALKAFQQLGRRLAPSRI